MADYDGLTPGQVLADASVAEFISQLGIGIAQAQRALDENSIEQIAEFITPRPGLGGRTLLDLGLSPAFYHFQHADISCSMQLTMKVTRNTGINLDIDASYGDKTSLGGTASESATSTESGAETSTEMRSATVEILAASTGALSVAGRSFALAGADALARVRALQGALTAGPETGIARAVYAIEPQALAISTDANDATPSAPKVVIGGNAVAFLGGGFDRAILQIDANADTTFTLNGTGPVTVATTAKADLAAYATHVAESMVAAGFDSFAIAPDADVWAVYFDTGRHHIAVDPPILSVRNATVERQLLLAADMIRKLDLSVTIEGFADRQPVRGATAAGSVEANKRLGDLRAQAVKDRLVAYGAPAARIAITLSGGSAGPDAPLDNPVMRRASIRVVGRAAHWVPVYSKAAGSNLAGVLPDKRSGAATGNGFRHLYRPTALSLGGKSVTVEGAAFPLSGAAAGDGRPSGSPEAYAANLAAAINAAAAAEVTASVEGAVVTVLRKSQPIRLDLVTAETREIALSGASGVTVTRAFTRAEARSLTRENTGNRAIAVGATVDVRLGRQFEMSVTGNSAISARLVSIPAPPEFLEVIRSYLKPGGAA